MVNEIGSEFSEEHPVLNCSMHSGWDAGVLTFSGRTAIETVLKNEPLIRKAMLPSYCCDSMIEPFRKAGISVCFYPVEYADGLKIELTIADDVDCLLWCNYFGFRREMPDVSGFISRGGIVIEDITHSLFSKVPFHEQSHYLVASVRKWEPILCGGYCVSRKRPMAEFPISKPAPNFLKIKTVAMQMKAKYLKGDHSVEKDKFLQLFSQSNHWLEEHYSGLAIDDYSKEYLQNADIRAHAEIRKRNAEVLYEELRDCNHVRFLFELFQMDCPLFVPIVIDSGKRDTIRRKLIEKEIYCPVHWPRPNEQCHSNLYDMELSLICDQRYNENDMHRIASVLKNV